VERDKRTEVAPYRHAVGAQNPRRRLRRVEWFRGSRTTCDAPWHIEL